MAGSPADSVRPAKTSRSGRALRRAGAPCFRQRKQQPVQRAQRNTDLRFDAAHPAHGEAPGRAGGVREQRGAPGPGAAHQQQCAAAACPCVGQRAVQRRPFVRTAAQRGRRRVVLRGPSLHAASVTPR